VAGVVSNLAIALVTSVLSGGFVWLWQRGRAARILHQRARFFRLWPGEPCIIVMNNRWDNPGSTEHRDVQAMVEAVILAREVGCSVLVRSSDEFREGSDKCVEFCVGGSENGSNVRTAGHLACNLPRVVIRPFSAKRDSMAIVVGGDTSGCKGSIAERNKLSRGISLNMSVALAEDRPELVRIAKAILACAVPYK